MVFKNFIDRSEFPTNGPYCWSQGQIKLPEKFLKLRDFEDYFSDDKLSNLLASFPSEGGGLQQFFRDAQLSWREIEKYVVLNGKNGETDLKSADRKFLLAKYRWYCFIYCNSLRELFLEYKKSVENLVEVSEKKKKLVEEAEKMEEEIKKLKKEIDKLENEIDEKISKWNFVMHDKVRNLDGKYYEIFSGNYKFLVENAEEYQDSLGKIKGDTVDFCTKIDSYIKVYKQIKDSYL